VPNNVVLITPLKPKLFYETILGITGKLQINTRDNLVYLTLKKLLNNQTN
jgi:hypothetical protein